MTLEITLLMLTTSAKILIGQQLDEVNLGPILAQTVHLMKNNNLNFQECNMISHHLTFFQ